MESLLTAFLGILLGIGIVILLNDFLKDKDE